ncbi:TPA: NADP-dependent oxidoreductase [Enterobacter ludwigii]|uniref:MDR family NADP-dependent oxidoreductase n=1 Tax=Enterobacter ludwigii TaxID=299767 RepID=UPI00277CA537|nr:NADP-dependent oxidoreductase [Enterobacter ludwigii]MDY3575100.1 NADP-dependent oxidoreductase [Enterobacter ludwigii]HDS4676814.1 NADP-dependent oxidoreductase [Enterobacter ludwigii]
MPVGSLHNREVKLIRHVRGEINPEDFAIMETAIPVPGPHEVVVRNRWFRVSISTRLMAQEDAKAAEGIPFPPLNPGDTLADGAIGEVIQTGSACCLPVGSLVMHPFGWREYAVVREHDCKLIDCSEPDPVAYLGHGWTAYAALTRGVQMKEGDTVFVSSGAGAIGSMAGQIARLLGASRVVGSTSSFNKARWMQDELGYDAVVTRDGGPMIEQLAKAAPEGIDVIVDMVGGEQLAAAVMMAREGARGVLLGALTAELNAEKASLQAPVILDTFHIIFKGMTLRGFSADHSPDAFEFWLRDLKTWKRDGRIHLPSATFKGIENATFALQEACAGRLKGVVLVEL